MLHSLVCWMSGWCHVFRSLLWPPSVSACWGIETGLFLQSSPFFFFFFPFQTLDERGNVCFHGMKAFRHPRWVYHQHRNNHVYGFNVERLKISNHAQACRNSNFLFILRAHFCFTVLLFQEGPNCEQTDGAAPSNLCHPAVPIIKRCLFLQIYTSS